MVRNKRNVILFGEEGNYHFSKDVANTIDDMITIQLREELRKFKEKLDAEREGRQKLLNAVADGRAKIVADDRETIQQLATLVYESGIDPNNEKTLVGCLTEMCEAWKELTKVVEVMEDIGTPLCGDGSVSNWVKRLGKERDINVQVVEEMLEQVEAASKIREDIFRRNRND